MAANHPLFLFTLSPILLSPVTRVGGGHSNQDLPPELRKCSLFPRVCLGPVFPLPPSHPHTQSCDLRDALKGESVVMCCCGRRWVWGEGTGSVWKLPSDSFACYLVAKVIVNLHLCCSDQSRPVRMGGAWGVSAPTHRIQLSSQGHICEDPTPAPSLSLTHPPTGQEAADCHHFSLNREAAC